MEVIHVKPSFCTIHYGSLRLTLHYFKDQSTNIYSHHQRLRVKSQLDLDTSLSCSFSFIDFQGIENSDTFQASELNTDFFPGWTGLLSTHEYGSQQTKQTIFSISHQLSDNTLGFQLYLASSSDVMESKYLPSRVLFLPCNYIKILEIRITKSIS